MADERPGPVGRLLLAVAAGAALAFVVSWYSSATLGIALGAALAALIGGAALRRR